jgi:hypothetical protein
VRANTGKNRLAADVGIGESGTSDSPGFEAENANKGSKIYLGVFIRGCADSPADGLSMTVKRFDKPTTTYTGSLCPPDHAIGLSPSKTGVYLITHSMAEYTMSSYSSHYNFNFKQLIKNGST